MADGNLEQPASKQGRRTGRIIFRVLLLAGLLCVGYFLYASVRDSARIPSRRTMSLNNVRNLNLAQSNHATQFDGQFATPTLFNEKGLAVHGWVTQLLPYLDQYALYNNIDLSLPWDHPDNREYSQVSLRVGLIPGLKDEVNSAGYRLLHYTLNERLFPNDESLTQDVLSRADGLSNTILMGEIQEGLPAWAEPGNARDPSLGLTPGSHTMGSSIHGSFSAVGFADGRAMAISNDIDPDVLKALSTPDGGEEVPDW